MFGEHGLSVEEITGVVDVGISKVRSTLKLFENYGYVIKQQAGRKFIYDADLNIIEKINSN